MEGGCGSCLTNLLGILGATSLSVWEPLADDAAAPVCFETGFIGVVRGCQLPFGWGGTEYLTDL